MDWSDERYVRLYTRDTATWNILEWQARCIMPLLLRKVDRAGIVDVGRHGPKGVVAAIRVPIEVVEPGLAQLLEEGVLVAGDGCYVFPNFLAAQDAVASQAQRKRDERERRRLRDERAATAMSRAVTVGHEPSPLVTPGHGESRDVTKRDSESRDVTGSHAQSRAVTNGHTVSLLSEPSLSEIPELSPAPAHVSDQMLERQALVVVVWERHRALRERLHLELRLADKLQPLHDLDPGRTELAARILERSSDLEAAGSACDHLLAVGEAEAREKRTLRWLDGGVWRADRFSRMLAMSPADARRMPQRSAPYDPEARRPKPRKVG